MNLCYTDCMEKLRALIFNIQKFSIHDGPGIRTVVFFKGCPLSCKWCSNPESQSGKIQILKPIRKGGSDQICGKYMNVDSVMFEVLQDKAFYEESGGGVTLSGGEPLVQIDFVQELLSACKKECLHTAVETTGFVTPEVFKRIFDMTDLFLFDVKHYDSQKHMRGTGVENDTIIRNLHALIEAEKTVLVRIPVIPDFNNSLGDAEGFADLFNKIGVKEIQLLPFHQFGQNKYRQLGIPYEFENYTSLHAEDLQEYKRILEAASLKVIL